MGLDSGRVRVGHGSGVRVGLGPGLERARSWGSGQAWARLGTGAELGLGLGSGSYCGALGRIDARAHRFHARTRVARAPILNASLFLASFRRFSTCNAGYDASEACKGARNAFFGRLGPHLEKSSVENCRKLARKADLHERGGWRRGILVLFTHNGLLGLACDEPILELPSGFRGGRGRL